MAKAEVIQLKTDRRPLGLGHIFAVRGTRKAPGGASDVEFFKGAFSKVTGLREEIESVTWRDGRDPLQVRKGLGTLAGGVVTFEKGIVSTPLEFVKWFNAIRFLANAQARAATPVENKLPSRENLSKMKTVDDAIRPILLNGMDDAVGVAPSTLLPTGDEFGVFADITISIGSPEYHPEQDALVGSQVGSLIGSILTGNIFGSAVAGAGVVQARAQYAHQATVIRAIRLFKCWPVAYQIRDLDALSSEIAIESLSVSFDDMEVVVDPAKFG